MSYEFLLNGLNRRASELRQPLNIEQPSTYNDYINWCKLYDQTEDSVQAVDKIGAVGYLEDRGLQRYSRTILTHNDSVQGLKKDFEGKGVIKCSHDSGSTRFIDFDGAINWSRLSSFYEPRLKREYGLRNGEWQYSMIEPRVLIEQQLPGEVPADYKFHCCSGEVIWCQYIYNRFVDTTEVNVLPDGTNTGILFDTNFKLGNNFTKPDTWEEMLELASELSKPYQYVRVDLFSADRVYFGELTFFPRGGYYSGEGQKELGKLLKIDIQSRKPLVWDKTKVHPKYGIH